MNQYVDVFQKESMQNTILWITGLAWFYKEEEIISVIGSTSVRFWAYTALDLGKITRFTGAKCDDYERVYYKTVF